MLAWRYLPWLVFSLLALPRAAFAKEAVLVLESRQGLPACVKADDLVETLTRHSRLEVLEADPRDGRRVVTLRVASDSGRLVVVLRDEGQEGNEVRKVLEPTPCAAATEVIAAFVASAMLPISGLPEPPASSPASSPASPSASPPGAELRSAAAATPPSAPPPAVERWSAKRRDLLGEAMRKAARRNRPIAAPVAEIGFGALYGAAGLLARYHDDEAFAWGFGIGGGVMIAGGSIALATPDWSYSRTVLDVSLLLGIDAAVYGFAQGDTYPWSDRATDGRLEGLWVLGGVMSLEAAAMLLDDLARGPISPAQVQRDQARLAGARAHLSLAELDRMQGDLRRTHRFRDRVVVAAPRAVGTVMCGLLAATADDTTEVWLDLATAALLAIGVGESLAPDAYDGYLAGLHRHGIDARVALGPGQLALMGTF